MSASVTLSADSSSDARASGRANMVTALSLTAFRNYELAEIECGRASVVLTGHNGAGKTNILEALSLLAPGRGMRKAKLRDMTHSGSKGLGWVISANLFGNQGEVQLGTGIDTDANGESRLVKCNGERLKSHTQLAQHLSIIWQTPQMDGLFLGSGTDRRAFLDRLVYNFDASHVTRINQYDYAMRERNKLLSTGSRDAKWLGVLEQRMAEQALAIADARNNLIERLNHAIMQSATSFPKAQLAMLGEVESALREGQPAADIEASLMQQWEQLRPLDAAAGRTTKGIHRSEFSVRHIRKNMEAAQCSTGEQKAMLLAILLAHARARQQWKGTAPILLLDEVVAHLDRIRRQELFDEISAIGAQSWLTGTDAADFSGIMPDAVAFHVENAQIIA